ncbi:Glycosyltransferase Gtf1 [uncultured archaeon]|nr:Glycosyltransferase Gtf1 [uncultured archaeon]
MKLKIAYIYDAVYPWVKGGAEKRIYELSRRLSSRGHEIHCYGMKWWPDEEEVFMDGVHLHGICRPMPLYIQGRRSLKQAAYFALRVLSIQADYDVIDCQNFPYLSCFSARIRCGPNSDKLIITWHEVWGDYWRNYLGKLGIAGQAVERAAAGLSKRNIAVSERTKRDLEELGARAVRVVPNGIDWKAIDRVPSSAEQSDIVCVGRLVDHKNIDLLIRAIGRIREELPDVKAKIIGDGPEATRLKSLVQELGLDKNVQFCGFLEDYNEAIAIMKSSRVFASTSSREGFGMAALEANACGLPVVTITHKMNAVSDLVTKETGVVCEIDQEALAEGLCRMLQSSDALRGRCREMARMYDWELICDRAEKAYAETEL